MITSLFSRVLILVCGTLYPAYASYKAVRTKDVKEYVKWMMYWIVFAFFTCIETFTDVFCSWVPLYYEVKVAIVFWLLSPATRGSSVLYRKFVHPMLTRHEQEIDEYVNQAKERGYSAVLQLGSKGVNYATNVIMQTAIKSVTRSTIDPRVPALANSRSANDLYVERDMLDANDFLPRVSSMSSISSFEYTGMPGQDMPDRRVINEMNIEELQDPEDGAARLRDMPARKAQARRAASSKSRGKRVQSNTDSNDALDNRAPTVIRSRRKLREPTPYVDVEAD